MSDTAVRSNGRFSFLDSLRGVAALAVACYHLGSETNGWTHRWFFERFNLGGFAVMTFFLVSGFIIPVSLQRHSLADFWRSRAFRLLPAYWMTILLTVGLASLGWTTLAPGLDRNHLSPWVWNLAMMSALRMKPTVVPVSWTLGLELIFYVLCSGLRLNGLLRRRVMIAWAALGGCLLLLAAASMHLYPPHFFKGSWIAFLLAAFVGSAFYDVLEGRATKKIGVLLLLAFLLVAAISLDFELKHTVDTRGVVFSFAQLFSGWLAGAFVFLAAFFANGFRYPVVLLWIGRISYSLYLLHTLVLEAFVHFFPAWTGFTRLGVMLGVALLLSDLSYRFIERPFLRFAKASHRREPTSPVAPVVAAKTPLA